MNVFSNYLKRSWQEVKTGVMQDILERMKVVYETDKFHGYYNVELDPHIVISSPLTLNEYNVPGTYTWECFNNDGFKTVIRWINKNILIQLTNDSYITTDVKIRIATSMINKLVNQEKLKKQHAILAHEILVANVAEIHHVLLDESLPF